MDTDHPNIQLMKQLDLGDLASAKDLFAENVVWHYFNPNLLEVQGDYVGLNGIRSFFQTIGGKTRGTFKVEPVSITAVGDELVVVQARDTLTFQGRLLVCDACIDIGIVPAKWVVVPGGRRCGVCRTYSADDHRWRW